jgi:hypothetical protein
MKIDELLKRLDNVKIDDDEKRKIAEYLARMLSVNDLVHIRYHIIMTKDMKIYDISSYRKLLKSGGISPGDAYVYVFILDVYHPASYYFPFLVDKHLLLYAYLSKLGFENEIYRIAPATGLKYVSVAIRYINISRVVVEVTDIGTVAINMKLQTLVRDIIGTKYIDNYKIKDIELQLKSQKLFDGYDFSEAWEIPNRYYEDHDTSLAKEVEVIKDAYNRIFQPYRVVYDLNTKQLVSSNK